MTSYSIKASKIVVVIFSICCGILSSRLTLAAGVTPIHFYTLKIIARLFLIFLMLFYMLQILRSTNRKTNTIGLWTIVMCILVLVSNIYSVDRINTSIGTIEFLSNVISSVYIGILIYREKIDLNIALLWISFPILAILFFYLLTDPDLAFRNMNGSIDGDQNFLGLGGQVIHVHSLSMMCVVLVHLLLWQTRKNVVISIIILMLGITCLMTLSRAGIIGLMLILAYRIMFTRSRTLVNMLAKLSIFISVMACFVFLGEFLVSVFVRGAEISTILTGSHRLNIFMSLIQSTIMQSPLLGFGYGNLSIYGSEFFVHDLNTYRTNAHSSYLQILASLGVIGLIAFVILQYHLIVNLNRISALSRGLPALVIVLILFQFAQTSLVGDTTPIQIMFFVFIGYTCEYRKRNG